MRALVVYESMYGNTHTVAEAVGRGLMDVIEVVGVVPVLEAGADEVAGADLLVVGGPTHVHGMTSGHSREAAVKAADDDDELHLEPHADGPGLRDWFDGLDGGSHRPAAAFDTRLDRAPALTGRASKGIAKRLRRHGYDLVGEPTSFLVDMHNQLLEGQVDLAVEWGRELGNRVAPARHG